MSFNLDLLNDTTALETDGPTQGGFTPSIPEEGVALFRLVSVIERGAENAEYQGKPKVNRPVSLEFELVHPRHAIKKEDGTFIRNHTVTVRLNKSFNERAKYFKLFNKLNYAGAVPTPAGRVPSFAAFLGKPFMGAISHNLSKDGSKTYVNIDKDGEYTIGAPRVADVDDMGTPTGEYKDIPVPEGDQALRCFLWETGVDDDTYRAMWESIKIEGIKKDGTPFRNFFQESICNPEENIEWAGSRAERLFDAKAAEADAAFEEVWGLESKDAESVPEVEQDDPLAALGL